MDVKTYKFKYLKYSESIPNNRHCYIGFDDEDGFVVYEHFPDKGNFIELFNAEWLENWLEKEGIVYKVIWFKHWTYPRLEYIVVSPINSLEKLKKLDELMVGLLDYPIFDDGDYSDWMSAKWQEYWANDGTNDFLWEIGKLIIQHIPEDDIVLDPFEMDDFLVELYEERGDYDYDSSKFIINTERFFHENEAVIVATLTQDKDFFDLYFAHRNPHQLALI